MTVVGEWWPLLMLDWFQSIHFISVSLLQVNLCQKLFSLQNMGVCRNCSDCQKQFLYTTCSPHDLSSYCGLVDAKIGASDKDLPVYKTYS